MLRQLVIIQVGLILVISVSGEWKSWSGWSACSIACGVGKKDRRRVCNIFPCIGSGTEERNCTISADCPGQWLSWYPWGRCTRGCGLGNKSRKRICHIRHVLSVCPGSRFERHTCTYEADCRTEWSTWSPWSACDMECGEGEKTRTRMCIRRRRSDSCEGDAHERVQCVLEEDCKAQWLTWGDWTQCHIRCGLGHRQRTRICDNPAALDPCPGNTLEVQTCTRIEQCSAHWQNWQPWSACNESCESGYKHRVRYCIKYRRSESCPGRSTRTEYCTMRDCPAEWTSWGQWNACDQGCGKGRKTRSRVCDNHGQSAWAICLGSREQHTNCTVEVDCPAYWAFWTSWSTCTSRCGMKTRTRACVNPHNALPCAGESVQNDTCSTAQSCSGTWSTWGEYSRCDGGCGAGYKHRQRTCIKFTETATCTGAAKEKRKCSYRTDCKTEWNSWKPWSQCSNGCGVGSKQRFRVCHRIRNTGNCAGNDRQIANCTLATDCPATWNSWSPWSDCAGECSGFTKNRLRHCLSASGERATSCPGENTQIQDCPLPNRCIAQWMSWGDWTDCDGGCGVGEKRRQRKCNRRHVRCNGTRDEVVECVPEVDCAGTWGEWGSWGECSQGCGVGYKKRSRFCLRNIERLPCVGNKEDRTQCSIANDCTATWSTWEDWGACSDGCGRGFKHRMRRCLHPVDTCVGEHRQPKQCSIRKDCPSCPENCKRCKDDSGRCDVGYCRRGYVYHVASGTCKAAGTAVRGTNRILQYFLAFVIVTSGSLLIATICYFTTKKMRQTYATSAVQNASKRSSDSKTSYDVLKQSVNKMSVVEATFKDSVGDPSSTFPSYLSNEITKKLHIPS